MRRTGPICARAMTAAMMGLLAAAASRAVAGDDAKNSPDTRFSVSGQVLDPGGRPVAGARVYVTPLADEKASRQPRATTGADGRFTFAVTRPEVPATPDWAAMRGLVQVIGEADGFAPAWSDRGEGTSDKPAVLRLARDDVPIEGTIADLEGRPVVGAKVRPTAVAAGIRGALDAFLQDYRANPLQSLYTSRGFRWLPTRPPGWPAELTTDDQGRFRLTGVGGERMVNLEVEGPSIETLTIHVLTRRDLDLKRADRTSPTYRMQYEMGMNAPIFHSSHFHHLAGPSRPIEGSITDRDTRRPIADVKLLAFIANHETNVTARSDAAGRYRLLGLPTEGKLQLYVQPGKGQPYLRQSVERRLRSAGEFPGRLDIPLARGVLVRGRIIDGATKQGVHGWIYYMPYADNPHLDRFPPLFGADTEYGVAPDGSFELVAVPGPGVVAAHAWEERYRASRPEQWGHPTDSGGYYATANRGLVRAEDFHAAVMIDPKPGAAELHRDVVLEPGLSVRGKLVDPDGRPVTGVSAYHLTSAGRGGIAAEPPVLDAAEFTAVGLDPDRPRQVWFLHRRRNLGRVVVLPDPAAGSDHEPITVTLQPCGTVLGRLVDADGRPRPDTQMYAAIQLRPMAGGPVHQTVRTDADGRFRITGLLPGLTYTLSGETVPPMGIGEITVRIGEVKDLGDLKK